MQAQRMAAGAIEMPRTPKERECDSLGAIIKWRELLQRAWLEEDLVSREFFLSDFRVDFHHTVNVGVSRPPGRTPFEQAITHFQTIARSHRARFCENPACVERYFIATHSGDKACSEECRPYLRKKNKKDWWNKTGKKRRKKAQQERKRKNAQKR